MAGTGPIPIMDGSHPKKKDGIIHTNSEPH